MNDPELAPEAKRHIAAAKAHERTAARHEKRAALMDDEGDAAQARSLRDKTEAEREAARIEWDRAAAYDGPTQLTQPKGKDKNGKPFEPVVIPIPTRDAFLRNLGKVAPASLRTSAPDGDSEEHHAQDSRAG
jgi:hypothetical protein